METQQKIKENSEKKGVREQKESKILKCYKKDKIVPCGDSFYIDINIDEGK